MEGKVKKPPVDWEAVEREYRAGVRSLADIGKEFSVSAPAIVQKAKRDGWERDLAAKIRAKAEAKVNAALVNNLINAESVANEKKTVEVTSQLLADRILRQRVASKKSVEFAESVIDEMIAIGTAKEDLDRLGEILAQSDAAGSDRMADAIRKIVGIHGRVDAGKKAVEMLRSAIELERKVLRISDAPEQVNATITHTADPNLSPSDAYLRMIGAV